MSSIVCDIGPIKPESDHWGQVKVEVKGGKRGTSSIYFTYRVNSHSHTYSRLLLLSFSFFHTAALIVQMHSTFDLDNKDIQKLSADFVV